jgi:hypothetical protein
LELGVGVENGVESPLTVGGGAVGWGVGGCVPRRSCVGELD